VFGDIRILIDAGHPKDLDGQPGCRSIPDQLESILGAGPHRFDLIVVTHCHDDHIGCMPELVAQGVVSSKWALVSDEGWGFGRVDDGTVEDGDFGVDDPDPDVRGLVLALCEEDHSTLSDGALSEFIDAVSSLPDRYSGMLASLEQAGTKVIRFQRDPIPAPMMKALAPTGFQVIGPEKEQLQACAKALNSFVKTATRATRKRKTTDADTTMTSLYREFSGALSVDSTDMAGTSGPPKNNQSIVLTFGGQGERVLLAGDMQLANAEMRDAKDLMAALRERIKQEGPYTFVKALHHTSYNGQDEDVLEAWGYPPYMAHSGGRNDANHPDSGALATLKSHSRNLQYARTDRNGIVEYSPGKGFVIEKGRTNDFTSNAARDTETEVQAAGAASEPRARQAASHQGQTGDSIVVIRIPRQEATLVVDGVRIEYSQGVRSPSAKEPRSNGTADWTKGLTPRPAPVAIPPVKLASGRDLRNLLFVTDGRLLARNIGTLEAGAVMDAITKSPNEIVDLAGVADAPEKLRSALARNRALRGVVIVGGYDVIPAVRLDVLSPDMRTALGTNTHGDADNFIVWSDDPYGDKTGDGLPDLPVSRIPDGRDAELLLSAISATTSTGTLRYGIRNTMRKFADEVWRRVPGEGELALCAPLRSSDTAAFDLGARDVYFMLHGSSADGRLFWGEQKPRRDLEASGEDGALVEAVRASQIPKEMAGIVFAGCCWGALTVKDLAGDSRDGVPTPRVPEASIALSCLKAGALAFIGCTGSHYSPNDSGGYAGGPLQLSFWQRFSEPGTSPAEALFRAKIDYIAGLPHGRTDLFELAIERKTFREFTCLGLGW
jgi:beta-lactamase superfamily II metal-dependent hydrolase